MSGGAFDYSQYRIEDIIERIQEEIENNKIKPDWISDEEWEEMNKQNYSSKTINEFKYGIKLLSKAQIYAQRIDWLISGDDSEDSFHERLKEDLEENKKKNFQ